jgi:hypothetical protein
MGASAIAAAASVEFPVAAPCQRRKSIRPPPRGLTLLLGLPLVLRDRGAGAARPQLARLIAAPEAAVPHRILRRILPVPEIGQLSGNIGRLFSLIGGNYLPLLTKAVNSQCHDIAGTKIGRRLLP